MGNGSSQPTPRTLMIQGTKPNRNVFIQNTDGRVTWMASEDTIYGGRSLAQAELFPGLPRESFDSMWARMHADTPEGFAVPLGDDLRGEVQQYYDTHPSAQFANVRGFAVTLLSSWVFTVKRSLIVLLYNKVIDFKRYVTEIRYITALLAASDRPEPFILFSDATYDRWDALIQAALPLDNSMMEKGIGEYIRTKLGTLYLNGKLMTFDWQTEISYLAITLDSVDGPPSERVYSDDAYNRWEALVARADQVEADLAARGIAPPFMYM